MKFLCIIMTLMIAGTVPRVLAQRLILTNPLDVDRPPQVVEMPLEQVLNRLHLSLVQANSIVAEAAETGERIPDQIYTSDSGSAPILLLLVRLPAHGRQTIAFRVDLGAPTPKALVFGREAPERKDDFAWENELVPYRVYGPALQATGEITSGIDVWSKRVPNFVIDSFYKRDLEGIRAHNPALSYHKDNGQGLDSYYVGPSRGCGGTAVFSGGKLFVSKNYTNMRILGNGPIRFSFEVSYAPWDANGVSVSETKRITLDAGIHLNRIESTYTFAGTRTLDLAAGIAVHENAGVEFPVNGSIASVWDTPQDPSAGKIATGLLADPSQRARTLKAAGPITSTPCANPEQSLSAFAPISPTRGETVFARPICLVQFEQRSGDNFAVRFRLWWTDFGTFAYCPYYPFLPEFGYIRWKVWTQATEWTVRKDSKICDLR